MSLKEPFLFQSYRTWSRTTLSSIRSTLNSLDNGRCSFIFTTLLTHITALQSPQKTCFCSSVNFHLPIQPWLHYKNILASPNNNSTPFLSASAIFHLPIFGYNYFNNQHKKVFSLRQSFSQFRLWQGTRKLGSLVRTETFLISTFFLKVRTVIPGIIITDFLSLMLKILVHCR